MNGIHTLTVTGRGDMRDDVTYTLEHGDCAEPDNCFIEQHLNELGVDTALCGVWGDETVPVGSYQIIGWSSKYDVPGEPVEYDAGVDVLEPEYSPNFRGDEFPGHRHWWRRVETAQVRDGLL